MNPKRVCSLQKVIFLGLKRCKQVVPLGRAWPLLERQPPHIPYLSLLQFIDSMVHKLFINMAITAHFILVQRGLQTMSLPLL